MIKKPDLLIILLFFLFSCAYYNTFYNAQQYFKKGLEAREKNKTGKLSSAEKKNFSKAIEKSFKVIKNYPDSKYVDDAIFLIARSYYFSGEYTLALKRFQELIINHPESPFVPEARFWRARCLIQLKEITRAKVTLKQVLKTSKKKKLLSRIHSLMAEIYLNEGKQDSALLYLNKAFETSWDDYARTEVLYKISEIYLEMGNVKEAEKSLEKIYRYNITPELKEQVQILAAKITAASEDHEKARKQIMKMLADEKNKDIWPALELELAKIYEKEKNYARATARYKGITENYPRTKESAEAYYHLGLIKLFQERDFQAARENFKKVKGEYKNSPFAVESQQRALEISNFINLTDEIATLKEKITRLTQLIHNPEPQDSVEINPENSNVVEQISSLRKSYELKKELEESNYDTVKIYQDYYLRLYEQGELLYFNLDQPDTAIKIFQQLSHGGKYNPLKEKALYMLYWIFSNQGQRKQADYYLQALKESYPASKYLAIINQDTSSVDTSSRIQDLYYQAEQLMHQEPRLAIAIFDSIVEDSSGDNDLCRRALYTIGYIYDQILLDTTQARLTYQKFMEKFPGSELAGMVSQRIEFLKSLHESPEAIPESEEIPIEAPEDTPSPDSSGIKLNEAPPDEP